ncbi:hypothetical protein BDN72DRAFT_640661 [Pluteus cervinus]|uniref:Uncharacterized protein n=1 Tax=Pluteus cervinus TaxID=181527 RepID=A0ACD3A035_9AGAR|nr:hypothetical protein BDN72DRAFT_640661 [Pluteus cervinus]
MTNFNQESLPRVVIFTSYGSPISDPQDNPTPPMKIADTNRVSLRHDDELGSVGLLLTHKEFGEYTQHSRSGHAFDKSLLQLVYRITGGYIGMINILFDMVQRHKSYTHPATQGKMYTLVDFIESIPISDFFNALLSSVVLRRVLPSRQDIDEGSNALRVVLETASIHGFVTSEMLTTANAKKALQSCFEKAWLHADLLHGEVRYIFPSPLHRRCIQAQLLGLVDQTDVQIVEETLPEFAWTILNLFLPSNLSTHGTASAASTEIQRAIYDEFYRCCCVHAKGPIVTPPEFGSRTESRVDLFIPQKRWGVQLLYNGDHLDEYASSFSTSGEYGAWIKSERGGDYIILNFCHEVPSKAHPGVSNLYHIVAEGCWNARIFDHELKLVVNEDSRNVRIPDNALEQQLP